MYKQSVMSERKEKKGDYKIKTCVMLCESMLLQISLIPTRLQVLKEGGLKEMGK